MQRNERNRNGWRFEILVGYGRKQSIGGFHISRVAVALLAGGQEGQRWMKVHEDGRLTFVVLLTKTSDFIL